MYVNWPKFRLSHDVASGSDITPCNKIDKPLGSIPLNIHEVWPRPFWGEAYRRKKIPEDHFIGHIPLLYKKLIKDQLY